MEAYVLLITIRPSDGDVKPGGPLGTFENSMLLILIVTHQPACNVARRNWAEIENGVTVPPVSAV